MLPYDLIIKDVFQENIQVVTNFAKKTGDYPSLSATDIKVMALTYQLEKEYVGTEHLRTEPIFQRSVNVTTSVKSNPEVNAKLSGFYLPGHKHSNHSRTVSESSNVDVSITEISDLNIEALNASDEIVKETNCDDLQKETEILSDKFKTLECKETITKADEEILDDILVSANKNDDFDQTVDHEENDDDDDEDSWITPSNIKIKTKQMDSEYLEEKSLKVACMTTDFAMQNVLKQMNLNVAALDGRMIKHLRTFILRCYTCFKMTSIMTKVFCPKCGNQTLKKVAVSLDEKGKQQIHINGRKPLTARGKKFSLPTPRGGKHPHNPILVADQPVPDNRPSRLARTKNNPLDENWIAGASPFIMRDVTSKSALLCIRPGQEMKYWMRNNPNELRKKKK